MSGEVSDETDDTVVKIYAGEGADRSQCTATLIAPNIILTALHCVSVYNPLSRFTCTEDGVLVPQNPGDGMLGSTVEPETVEVFVGTDPGQEPDAYGLEVFGSGSPDVCRGDIAAVVLDREIGTMHAPVRLLRPTPLREMTRVVGYGITDEPTNSQRHRRNDVRVIGVGENDMNARTGVTTPPRTFALEKGACQGDSGGPAISQETGAVIGVYSISFALSCSQDSVKNTYTMVAPFEPVIRRAFESVSQEPDVEPPLPEAGASGGGMGGMGGSAGSGGAPMAGTAGSAQAGEGDGSGSRRAPSCACRLTETSQPAPGAWLAAMALGVVAALRRRRGRA